MPFFAKHLCSAFLSSAGRTLPHPHIQDHQQGCKRYWVFRSAGLAIALLFENNNKNNCYKYFDERAMLHYK